jgi:hypothetical protein
MKGQKGIRILAPMIGTLRFDLQCTLKLREKRSEIHREILSL